MTAMHTGECTTAIREIEAAIAAFEARWPDYCRECGGSGLLVWSDPDVGIFQAFDPCTFCESNPDSERCALCGQLGDFSTRTLEQGSDDLRPCGCPVTDYLPEHAECICYAGLVDLPF